jgi:hypothetical protein
VDLGQHFVEGVSQHAQLVLAEFGGAHTVIFLERDGLGGFRQFQNGPGDQALEPVGDQQGDEQGTN